jgi:hypothetical protein
MRTLAGILNAIGPKLIAYMKLMDLQLIEEYGYGQVTLSKIKGHRDYAKSLTFSP